MKVHLPVRKAILLRRTYEAPAEGRAGKIRLDFNENTTGCSTAARRALARLSAKQIATYPEYEAPTRKLARYFRVHTRGTASHQRWRRCAARLLRHFRRAAHGCPHLRTHFPDVSLLRRNRRGARESFALRRQIWNFHSPKRLPHLRKKPRLFFLANPNNPDGHAGTRGAMVASCFARPRTPSSCWTKPTPNFLRNLPCLGFAAIPTFSSLVRFRRRKEWPVCVSAR